MTREELIEVMARAIDRLEYLALARAENATDRNDAKAASAAARAALSALDELIAMDADLYDDPQEPGQ